MSHVVIIGCGVVGAMIAYELSHVPGLRITVCDRQAPAQASTGAALGVLVGFISHKVKGNAWQLRETSLRRYDTLIPELEAQVQHPIPYNQQGILHLCFADTPETDIAKWHELIEIRKSQGYPLHWCDRDQVLTNYPHLNPDLITGAVYSPGDRQVNPTILTQALVTAATQRRVTFYFDAPVESLHVNPEQNQAEIHTPQQTLQADWVVIAAGLGSTPLTTQLAQPVQISPVFGQALQVRLPQTLGKGDRQPVITGNDVHIVPINETEYWVGATVEFPTGAEVPPDAERLDAVWNQAIAFCPTLAAATIVKTWCGQRPRPENRPAPIIEWLPGYRNILLATGHYRNGILLAPATALKIRDWITN